MEKRRVVVTGTGLVTPLGTGTAQTWEGLCSGRSGIGRISRFDCSEFPVQIAAEVSDFDAEKYFDKKRLRHLDLFVQYALVAANMAMEDAGLTIDAGNASSVGVVTGCGMGGLPTIESSHSILLEKGPKRITPFLIPMIIPNMASGHISIETGAKGPNLAISTACAAGSHAVGEAFNLIRYGHCDAAITGGCEAVVSQLAVAGFSAMKALSQRNDDPARASRPFDRDRDGFIIGEGAGMLVMEELSQAVRRNARIYAEIVGFGLTGDAFHMAAPPENGEGAARCMAMALKDAKMQPEEVGYINAHGTSTPLNDRCETLAIKRVFGDWARKLAISSTKSMTGHLLGGAGGIEAVFTSLALHHQIMPPTINQENPDPDCDLDYVPNQCRRASFRAALSNSFGFGGTNAVLAFRRFEA